MPYIYNGEPLKPKSPTSKNDNNAYTCNPTPAHIIHTCIHVGCHALVLDSQYYSQFDK